MLKSRVKNWPSVLAPVGLCALVLGLGAIPYVLFRRDQGSWGAFTSAFDESTYLLDGPSVPYRLVSDLVLGAFAALTPGPASLLVVTDILLPVIVALAAWALVTRCFAATGPRVLAVLLLLFGQELFSLANSIVWPDTLIGDLRTSDPPLSLELIPDATTSYFSLYRTPEPQVSWAILFGFLALIAGPDPLRAFEGSRRWLTFAIFAVLPLIYPFVAVPIFALAAALTVYAVLADRPRARGVLGALGIMVISWVAVTLVAARGSGDTTSVVFDSRLPTLTPAILIGVAIAAFMLFVHRAEAFRRAELLVALVCSVLPVAIGNQQIVTGMMVSGRDWERNSSYVLLAFAVIVLISTRERSAGGLPKTARGLAWGASAVLAVSLVFWQREVYRAWSPTNDGSRQAAELLDGLPAQLAGTPIVMEDAGLVPTVRLLTDDEYDFVLDYTRLSEDPIPGFADGWEGSGARAASQERIFEYWFRLGRSPAQVRSQLEAELGDITMPGFYSHFLFSFRDVWPPLTDWRGLKRDQALQEVPGIVEAYSGFLDERGTSPSSAVILITNTAPEDPGDGRRFELLGSATDAASTPGAQIYLERFVTTGDDR